MIKNDERHIAIGDSYTLGQRVLPEESWPFTLKQHLRYDGHGIILVYVIAKTGWTTQNIITETLHLLKEKNLILVTVQIGVND